MNIFILFSLLIASSFLTSNHLPLVACESVKNSIPLCARCDANTSSKEFYLKLLTNHSAPFFPSSGLLSSKPLNTSSSKLPEKDELYEPLEHGILSTLATQGDDAYVYRGQLDPKTADRSGVGFVVGKAFPLIYIGRWRRGYKNGFGVNIDFCRGNFVLQGGFWSQGLFYRTAAIPSELLQSLSNLSGCADIMAVLEAALPFVPGPDDQPWEDEGEEEFLQDRGVYFINVSDTKYALDIYGGSDQDDSLLINYSQLHGGPNQQFIARRTAKNTYVLSPKHAPCKALDLKSESNLGNVQIVQRSLQPLKTSQQWTLERNPDESFSLRNCYSKLYLMANDGGGPEMVQAERQNNPKQRFLFRRAPTPRRQKASPHRITPEKEFMIRLRRDGRVLDVRGGSASNSTPIITWEPHGGNNQAFKFISISPQDPNTFFIASGVGKDKVLDVSGGGKEDGNAVILYGKHGGHNQQWRLVHVPTKGEEDDVQIQSVHSHKCLDIDCSGIARIATCNRDRDSQIFSLQRREISPILAPETRYRITIRANSKRLAVEGAGNATPKSGVPIVQQLPMSSASGQIFLFESHGDDVYSIFPEHSNGQLALSPFQPGTKTMDGIILRAYSKDDKLFHWRLINHNDIYYYLQNVASGMFLEVSNEAASKVYQNVYGQKPEQLFAFDPVTSGVKS